MHEPELSGKIPPRQSTRPRRSRFSQLLMVFGIASTILLLFCCVTTFLFHLDPTTNPREVEAIAQNFAPFKLPDGFRGAAGVSGDNSLMWVQIARFEQIDGRGQFVIGGIRMRSFLEGDENDAKGLEMLLNGIAPGIRLLDVQDKQLKTITIRGKAIGFEIIKGEDRASTTRFRQVTGTFPGPNGAAQIILQVEDQFITDKAIDDFLQSFADPVPAEPKPDSNLNSK